MKPKSIFLVLFVGFSLSMFAQQSDEDRQRQVQDSINASERAKELAKPKKEKKPMFWIGPKFGLDITSTTRTTDELTKQLSSNYQFGIMCQYGRTFYIQPEIYYSSYKAVAPAINATNYIKIPLMLGVKFLDLGLFSFHGMGGPALAFELDDKDKPKEMKDLAWQVGLGLDVFGFITADLRYTSIPGMSISNQISKFSSSPTNLNLTVGLKLRKGD
jgi:hypothetical protein